jgi:hypothetical protein
LVEVMLFLDQQRVELLTGLGHPKLAVLQNGSHHCGSRFTPLFFDNLFLYHGCYRPALDLPIVFHNGFEPLVSLPPIGSLPAARTAHLGREQRSSPQQEREQGAQLN